MNPPYDSSLHLKILDKVIKAAPSSEIVCLHPRNYYDSLSVYYNNKNFPYTRNCYTRLVECEDIDKEEAQKAFNQGFNTLNLIIGKYNGNHKGSDAWSEKDKDIRKKMRRLYKEPGCGFDNIRVSRKNLGKKPYFLFNQYNVTKPEEYFASESSKVSYGVEFDTQVELDNWKTWFLGSKIVKWLISKNTCGLIIPQVDWKTPWTDEMLYEYFGLTEDEIKEIDIGTWT